MQSLTTLSIKGFTRIPLPQCRQYVAVLMAILVVGCGVRSTAPQDVNQRACRRHMRDISIAVDQYLAANGDLPLDPLVADAVEDRPHCWVSLILPNMYETRDSGPYRFDLSWDSPENTRLGETLHVFTCLEDPGLNRRERSYFLLGELNPDIADPKERYKLVEIHDSGVPRLSPVPEMLRHELLFKVGVAVHRAEK